MKFQYLPFGFSFVFFLLEVIDSVRGDLCHDFHFPFNKKNLYTFDNKISWQIYFIRVIMHTFTHSFYQF